MWGRWFVLAILVLVLIQPIAAEQRIQFNKPDIRDDFCGAQISYQYCKCAFHGDYCNAVGMSESEARRAVYGQYRTSVRDAMESFARNCMDHGDIWNKPTRSCYTCEEGEKRTAGRCVQEAADIQETYGLPDVNVPEVTNPTFTGRVSTAEGEVFVYSASFKRWIGPVRAGQGFYPGDIVKTTDRGSAKITFYLPEGEKTMDLSTETMLEVAQPEEETDASLIDGALRIYNELTSEPTRTPINVRTPTVVATIRGTDFVLTHIDGVSSVYVEEGEVAVRSAENSEEIMLGPGQGAIHDPSLQEISVSKQDWQQQTAREGLSQRRHITIEPLAGAPIDPDAVYPPEVAYTGDLVGEIEIDESSWTWAWILLLVLLGVIGYRYDFHTRARAYLEEAGLL